MLDSAHPAARCLPPRTTPTARTRPTTFDEDLTFDTTDPADLSGPYELEVREAETGRLTLRSDLTMFIPDWYGQHDMKMGGKVEFEEFDQTLLRAPADLQSGSQPPRCTQIFEQTLRESSVTVSNANSAENTTIAFYVQ